jgi:hypothetical protein
MIKLDNVFKALNSIDVNDHIERKNGLSYLSWAFAWSELKSLYPRSFYTIYENKDGLNYHTDGRTCWVKTGVTLVNDEYALEHIEYLPVMDYRNASIPLEKVTSFDVNKAIQRSLTKAVARHGLGLYIYAGEDLPEDAKKKDDSSGKRHEDASDVASPLDVAISEIDTVAKELPGKGVAKTKIGEAIKSVCGTPNYKKITEVEVAHKVLEALKNLGGNE